MSVHDSGWPTSLIFCENDRHFTISSCYLFDMYVVYVLCRVCPNDRDEVKDETCEDVPMTAPMSALLISNQHIQVVCVVLETPSRLLNPSQAYFVNYVLLLLPMFIMEQLYRLCVHLEACELCELCGLCELSSYMNYVDLMLYAMLVSTCHPCGSSMNCYMLCICLNCTYVLRSVEEIEKNFVSRPIAPASVARQPSWNTVQMVVAPSKVE